MTHLKTLCIASTAVLTLGCAPNPYNRVQPPTQPSRAEITVNPTWCAGIHSTNQKAIDRMTDNMKTCLNSGGGFNPKKSSCKDAMIEMKVYADTNVGTLAVMCLDSGYSAGISMSPSQYEAWIGRATVVLSRFRSAMKNYAR